MDPHSGLLQCLQQHRPWEYVPRGEGPHLHRGCVDGVVLWGTILPPPQLLRGPAGGPSWPWVLMTPSAVICTGVGAWTAGLGKGGDWGSLANISISLYISAETGASPSDVRA